MKNLTYIMPCFVVAELKISVSFYVNKLGFEVRYIGPDEDPYWAIIGRDDISIMLKPLLLKSNQFQTVRDMSGHQQTHTFP